MKNNIYLTCGVMALAFAACSEDNGIVGTSTEPNTFAHDFSSSEAESLSSSVTEKSSSSDFELSSSAVLPKMSSSSSVLPESSSSLFKLSSSRMEPYSSAQASSSSSGSWPLSSSSRNPVLCKTGYANGGCAGVDGEGDLWSGYKAAYEGTEYIDVGLYADSSWKSMASGEWFVVLDSADAGKSDIRWPVKLGNDSNPNSFTPVIERCNNGLCGTAVLEKGSLTYNPFVLVGFTLAKDGAGKQIPVDVSNWNGICVFYQSDVSLSLELGLEDSVSALMGYALPSVSLSKTSLASSKCFEWSEFKLPSWVKSIGKFVDLDRLEELGWLENAGEMAAKQLVAVRFKIQAQPGEYNFNIMALGTNLE